jgi:antitoxin (DNA-binding transcriptional repressor) of toxin-antitoxin stability system
MTKVGIRYLKTHLSRCLNQVRRGRVLTITDRRKTVAAIVPWAAGDVLHGRLERLRARGILVGDGLRPRGLDRPLRMSKGRSLSAAILEDRG